MMVLIMTMAVIVLAAAGLLGIVYTAHVATDDARSRADAEQQPPGADRVSDTDA